MKAEYLQRYYLKLWNFINTSAIRRHLNAILEVRGYTDLTKKRSTVESNIKAIAEIFGNYREDRYLFRSGMADGSDFSRFLSPHILNSIEQAYSDYKTTGTFFDIMTGISGKFDDSFKKLTDVYIGLISAGVDYNLNKDSETPAIEIVLPKIDTLHNLSRWVADQDGILQLFNESIFGTREDVLLLSASSSRLSIFVKSNYTYITHFSAALCFLLTSANAILDIKVKMNEISNAAGIPYDNEYYNKAKEKLAEKCAASIAESLDESTNFDLQKCTVAARRILESIENGFEYHIHIPMDESLDEEKTKGGKGSRVKKDTQDLLLKRALEIDQHFLSLPPKEGLRQIAKQESSEP